MAEMEPKGKNALFVWLLTPITDQNLLFNYKVNYSSVRCKKDVFEGFFSAEFGATFSPHTKNTVLDTVK